MISNIKNFIRVGIVHFMLYPEILKDESVVLDRIKRTLTDEYFDSIEITNIHDIEIRRKAVKMYATSRVKIHFCGQPMQLGSGLNINDLDKVKRQEAIRLLKSGIDRPYECNAESFAYLSGRYDEQIKVSAYNALLESTYELCEYAGSKGDMPIVLEVFDYDIDKKSIIGPSELAAVFAADIRKKYDNFGLMIDLSHLPLTREKPLTVLETVKDYLVHVHIGNAVCRSESLEAYGDMHPRFGFPGSENDVDELCEFIEALFKIGYLKDGKRPTVSFEVKPWGDEDSELVLINAKRTLNEAWTKIKI